VSAFLNCLTSLSSTGKTIAAPACIRKASPYCPMCSIPSGISQNAPGSSL
jgi:hypothetical protein